MAFKTGFSAIQLPMTQLRYFVPSSDTAQQFTKNKIVIVKSNKPGFLGNCIQFIETFGVIARSNTDHQKPKLDASDIDMKSSHFININM